MNVPTTQLIPHSTRMVPLSSVDADGFVIKPEFWAKIDDELVFVTAVLERTVVFVSGDERKLTNRRNCWVDPDHLVMHPVTTTWGSRAKGAFKKAAPVIQAEEPSDEDGDMPAAVGWSELSS